MLLDSQDNLRYTIVVTENLSGLLVQTCFMVVRRAIGWIFGFYYRKLKEF